MQKREAVRKTETQLDTIKIKLTVDAKNAIKNLEKAKGSVKDVASEGSKTSSTASKLQGVLNKITGSIGQTVQKTVDYLGKAYKESNDYVEAVNLFNVTMGDGATAAKEYADSLQSLMGIDSKEWMNYQGSLNEMVTGFGIANDKANEMSQQLTQVAYDLSSLWNVNVSEAFHKIQSGMSGQVKGLKTWGINLSVAQLKETALAHGIDLSVSKMTEAQKATLRYVTIMEKTANIQGDLARTIVTPANALRILKNQFTVLRRTIGDIVSTVVTQFIPVFQLMVEKLTVFATKLRTLFGYEAPTIDYSNMKSAVDYSDELDDSLQDSTENAKKLKNVLMGFDEINKLSDTSSDTSTALGGGMPDDLGLDLSQYDYDFTKGIDTSGFKATVDAIAMIVSGAMVAIGVFLLFMGNIPLGIAFILTGVAIGVTTLITGNDNMSEDIRKKLLVITGIVGAAMLAIGAILLFTGQIPLGIALLIAGITITAVTISNGSKLSDDVRSWLSNMLTVVGAIAVTIGIMLLMFGVSLPIGFAILLFGLTAIFAGQSISDGFKTTLLKWLSVISGIITGALLMLGVIALITGNIPLGLGLMLAAIGTSFAAYKFGGGDKGFVDYVKGIINAVISVIETGVNWIVDKINSVGFHWDVPEAIRKAVGFSSIDVGFNLHRINIPRLADGGYVPDGDIFMANEAGPELVGTIGRRTAVANTMQISEAMKQAAYEGMVQALKEQGNKTNYVVLEIDGEKVTKKVIQKHNELVKQTGSSPLLVGG